MQNPEAERTRVFSRRLALLGGAQVLLFGVLGARLHHLQVREAPAFALRADNNRISQRLLTPARGRILDRNGIALADNEPFYRVRIVRERVSDVEAILDALAELIPITPQQRLDALERARSHRAFVPVVVRNDLTWEEVATLAVRSPELPGVMLDSGLVRRYAFGPEFAHVLGYVGPPNERDLQNDPDPLLRVPDQRIGRSGIEGRYDALLRGKAGLLQMEVNVVGREIRELQRRPGVAGRDVELTIHKELQRYAHRRIASELSASAVILDVETGEVLAMASVPGFEPGAFTNGVSHRQWNEWRDDPRAPLVNKALSGIYPPGSTFKMITGLAAMEAGIVDARSTYFCPGHLTLGTARFHCWRPGGHGSMAMVQALAQSCDVYFYEAGRRVGIDAITAMANRFGLGVSTGIDLPSERTGLMPTRAWKEASIGERWQPGDSVVASIGQGYLTSTPLQLAVMTARMCNGGYAVSPWLARPVPGDGRELIPAPKMDIAEHHLKLMKDGMYEAVNGSRGTARSQRLLSEHDKMGGKTGTSQVRRITRAERAAGLHRRQDRPWRDRHHALFVGYAPYERPRYAVSVVVEHGGSGSAAAAPIARDLLQKALDLDPSGPRLSAEGASPKRLTAMVDAG
ncbi:MAG: penicillin-binding protein 2 [Geminicoccaceae bacterium]|nr:MAG: penicillin-binding protein 2 [Geminicoccaceae bacterium]